MPKPAPARFGFVLRAIACALLVWAATAPAAQQPRARPTGSAPVEAAVPFRVGERLDYRVGWTMFNQAASLQLHVRERRPFFGRHAWHFQAVARTLDPVRSLYVLDDQFDSYTDTRTLAARQFEMYLRERGESQNVIVRYRAEDELAWSDQRMTTVPAGTRDPLGLIHYLRTVDWTRERSLRVPVHDGRKLYEVEASLSAASASTTVPAGSFSARQIAIRVFEGEAPVRGVSFQLWLANDARRTPVRIEASLPFGTLRVELERSR
jgi:hypothetical protein